MNVEDEFPWVPFFLFSFFSSSENSGSCEVVCLSENSSQETITVVNPTQNKFMKDLFRQRISDFGLMFKVIEW